MKVVYAFQIKLNHTVSKVLTLNIGKYYSVEAHVIY
jgi:hypothetical protein